MKKCESQKQITCGRIKGSIW